jgi:hypothetical protein
VLPAQGSVERATQRMSALGLQASQSPVFFGQLLGMADHITQVSVPGTLGLLGQHLPAACGLPADVQGTA